jgi:hypothetical protein
VRRCKRAPTPLGVGHKVLACERDCLSQEARQRRRDGSQQQRKGGYRHDRDCSGRGVPAQASLPQRHTGLHTGRHPEYRRKGVCAATYSYSPTRLLRPVSINTFVAGCSGLPSSRGVQQQRVPECQSATYCSDARARSVRLAPSREAALTPAGPVRVPVGACGPPPRGGGPTGSALLAQRHSVVSPAPAKGRLRPGSMIIARGRASSELSSRDLQQSLGLSSGRHQVETCMPGTLQQKS